MPRDPPLDPPPASDAAAAADAALDRDVADVTPIEEGLNAVYRVTLADGARVVLKAATLATDAEFRPEPRLLDRLDRETSVPVPSVRATVDGDDSPLGVAHYLADYCEGRAVRDVLELDPSAHERLVVESGRHLAALHALTFDGFGRLRADDSGGLRVADPRASWRECFRELAAERVAGLRGEGFTADDDPRFADLAGDLAAAFEKLPADAAGSVEAVLLHGDYRPANLVLAPPGERPVVEAVLDVGAQTGDGLLDLALAESSLVDVPLGGTERATALRRRLRAAYLAERSVPGDAFELRYPCYRLYAWTKCLGAFDFFAQFARESDPDAAAARWRSAAEACRRACEAADPR